MNILRHSCPNIYDQAPLGTQCYVFKNEKEYEVYIQRSKDEEHPVWEYTGVEYKL